MVRLPWFCGLLLLAGCAGGQSTTDPCVRKMDVIEVANLTLNTTTSVHANLTVTSGACLTNEAVSWASTSPNIAPIVSSNDSVAVVRGQASGRTYLVAFLTRIPATRDSIQITVVAPIDIDPVAH